MTRYFRLGALLFVSAVGAIVLAGCGSDAAPASGGAGSPAQVAGSGAQAAGSAGAASAGAPGATAGAGQGGASSGSAGSNASGAGNMAGASGSNGSGAGAAGSAGASGGTAQMSAGCGMPAGQALHTWVEQPKMQVKGVDRQWWVWLPNGYMPSKPYPVIFLFHGCGGADNVVPMQNATNDQAILVRGAGISNNSCWDQAPDGVDVTFFDQMLSAVSAQRCVDTSHAFAVGYSSGSWLVNSLDCRRADKLRGAASVSGGVQSNNCTGRIARIFLHDKDDTDNVIAGSYKERDRLIGLNHCSTTTMPDSPDPCVRYQGCDPGYPIDFCETSGKHHARQDALAPNAFWKFFSAL
jgi:polyhydroxybutyrate depolymerase